jgi:hypothetical protein
MNYEFHILIDFLNLKDILLFILYLKIIHIIQCRLIILFIFLFNSSKIELNSLTIPIKFNYKHTFRIEIILFSHHIS